jgi:hypothetical protein
MSSSELEDDDALHTLHVSHADEPALVAGMGVVQRLLHDLPPLSEEDDSNCDVPRAALVRRILDWVWDHHGAGRRRMLVVTSSLDYNVAHPLNDAVRELKVDMFSRLAVINLTAHTNLVAVRGDHVHKVLNVLPIGEVLVDVHALFSRVRISEDETVTEPVLVGDDSVDDGVYAPRVFSIVRDRDGGGRRVAWPSPEETRVAVSRFQNLHRFERGDLATFVYADARPDRAWWFDVYDAHVAWQMGCTLGRIKQMAGTCWFNSVMNLCIMCAPVVDALVRRWHDLPDAKKRTIVAFPFTSSCPSRAMDFGDVVWIAVYNLVVRRRRVTSSLNVSSGIAAHVKRMYGVLPPPQSADEDAWMSFAEAGNPDLALAVMLEAALPLDVEFVRDYWFLPDEFEPRELRNTNASIVVVTKSRHPFSRRRLPQHLTVVRDDGEEEAYALWGAMIVLADEHDEISHAIAGLRCDDTWFVYDSQNTLVRCQWHELDFDDYEAGSGLHVRGFDALVYAAPQ